MDLRSRTPSGIFWSSFAALGCAFVQVVQLALLGRVLGAGEFGLMAMATVALGIANAYTDVGMNNAIVTHAMTKEQRSSLYFINWLASITAAVAVFLLAPVAAWAWGEQEVESVIRLLAGTLLVAPLGLQYQLLLQKEMEIRPIAFIEVGASVLGLVTAVLSAHAGIGALSLVYGALVTSTTKSVLFFAIGCRRWPVSRRLVLKDIQPYLSFGAYQVGERTLNFAAWNLDKVMIGGILGAHALGIYSVAYQLMQKPLQLLTPIVSKIALPLFSSMNDDLARLREGYLSVIRWSGLLLFPVFALMVVAASPLIQLVVGNGWGEAASVLRWLALLGVLYTVGVPVGSLLLARGRADVAFWLNVLAIILYGIAVLVGSPYGVNGVAMALVTVQLGGLFVIGFWVRWKVAAMRPIEFLRAFTPQLVMAAVAGLGTYSLFGGSSGMMGGTQLGLSALAMGGMYLLLTLIFFRKPVRELADLYKSRKLLT